MSRQPDEDGQLTSLLRALPVPEPQADLVAGARRRYRAVVAARDRRHAWTGLVAAVVALTVTAILLGWALDPVSLGAWLAEPAADLARWTAAVGVVMALVPLPIWTSAVLGSIAAALSLVVIARARSLAVVKVVK
jgi:hypothetical protein